MHLTGNHRDNPARERNARLTERASIQRQDYHRERTKPASDAYAEGWDRIWGKKAEGWPCERCGQFNLGQTGEYPCPVCGLPTLWHDVPGTTTDGREVKELAGGLRIVEGGDTPPMERRTGSACKCPEAGPCPCACHVTTITVEGKFDLPGGLTGALIAVATDEDPRG